MIVQSFGQVKAMTEPAPWQSSSGGSVNLYSHTQAYATIYATQPNVRTCVDFLARNIAQLGIHAFRRISNTDRERLPTHDVVRWLGRPNPSTRRYRLIESLMGDLGIYFDAYWLKVRYQTADGRDAIGFVRLPPDEMDVEGALLPTQFAWTRNGHRKHFPLSEVVHFDGYNPLNPLKGLSPLETLRRVLAEESAAGDHREMFWRNAGRIDGVVTRPKGEKRYTETQAISWREQWQAVYAGGANAGKTVLLQDGETFTPGSWSAKDSEYLSARKLSREECAAAYHIPLPLVGILEHATFSNIKEQHKHLYQDCLGPWLEMLQAEFEGQILIECDDQRDVYIEFNIAEKLKGSFEEQSASLHVLAGRPIMTANEARARLNLPAVTDDPSANELAPQQGGPASSADAEPAPEPEAIPTKAAVDLGPVIQATRERQQARLAKLPATDRPAHFAADLDRWNRELAADLSALTGADETALAASTNAATLAQLEADALAERMTALERRPEPEPTPAPHVITLHLTMPEKSGAKQVTLQRDASGAVTGAAVEET